MTDKEMNLQTAPRPKTTPRGAKPPIGKTAAAPAATPPPEPAAPASPPRPAPKPNGQTAADIVSTGREALLGVDSYEQAETVLTEQPALIEQARAVFGSIVPTSGQNQFIDLAIKAAADDDPTDLRSALKTKRRRHLNLTSPEIGQLLEFAAGQTGKSPVLALNVALLLTDDLTRLEEAALWQTQKDIILTLEKALNLDAMALWADINPDEAAKKETPPPPEPQPAPVKVRVKTPRQKRPAPPPPPLRRGHNRRAGGPPRWLLASGFIALMATLSCGLCALGNWL